MDTGNLYNQLLKLSDQTAKLLDKYPHNFNLFLLFKNDVLILWFLIYRFPQITGENQNCVC